MGKAQRMAPRSLRGRKGREAHEVTAAIRAQAFAATAPTHLASACAVDHADRRQRAGWAHGCLRPCGLAPAPSAVCGRGEAETCCSVGNVTLAPLPPGLKVKLEFPDN